MAMQSFSSTEDSQFIPIINHNPSHMSICVAHRSWACQARLYINSLILSHTGVNQEKPIETWYPAKQMFICGASRVRSESLTLLSFKTNWSSPQQLRARIQAFQDEVTTVSHEFLDVSGLGPWPRLVSLVRTSELRRANRIAGRSPKRPWNIWNSSGAWNLSEFSRSKVGLVTLQTVWSLQVMVVADLNPPFRLFQRVFWRLLCLKLVYASRIDGLFSVYCQFSFIEIPKLMTDVIG